MKPALLQLLFAPLLMLASCGSEDSKRVGLEAVQAGKWTDAVACLDAAIAHLPPESPDYMEIAMGRCTALAYVDATRAKTEFEALIVSGKARVTDFGTIVSHLVRAEQYMPAIELMDKGLEQFPGDEQMLDLKDSVVAASKQAAASNDPAGEAARKRLESMGYLGD